MWRAVNPLTWRLQGGLKLPDRRKPDPAAEAECADLLRLLGHGRHGLQSMDERNLSLEPCKNLPAQDHRSPRRQEQAHPEGANLKVDKYNQ
jgi:hypothetical protein